MAIPRVKKKPTNKEMASAIIEINNRLHETMGYVQQLDRVIGLYVAMNNDNKKFNKYINEKLKEEKLKEDDKKKNGTPNNPDIPQDTKDKGSGSKGIRKKKE